MRIGIFGACPLAILVSSIVYAGSNLTPILLHAGINRIPNIAGDGAAGTINLQWRDNGNAWGYNIYTVSAGGSIATLDDKDQITDAPHTGEDIIASARFARGVYYGKPTLFVLIAKRNITNSVPERAETNIQVYALTRNLEGIGTPYQFSQVTNFKAKRRYCNADMALKSELGFPLARRYSGSMTIDGCPG